MIAANRHYSRLSSPPLRLHTAPEPDTRITSPGVSPPPGLKAASDAVLRRSREVREARDRQELTADQKLWVSEHVTLRGYYEHFVVPLKRLKRADGKISNGTLQKDRQALNRWEKYTRPDDWPESAPWEGLVLGAIDAEDVEDFALRARSQGELAPATIRSTWNHLRTICNHAWRQGVLSKHLSPEAIDAGDDDVTIYEDDQIERAYRAFDDHRDLQVAYVLGILCGPRTEDLFSLRWSGVRLTERAGPTLVYTARKTGKQHGVPLCDTSVRHLRRLPRVGPHLFPALTEPGNKDPGKSRTARERNAEIKRRLLSVGITFAKPFQAARATCNERLESHRQGAGQFVLGHALTLNSKSYRRPDKLIRTAINTLEPPPCFRHFEGCDRPREFAWSD